MDKLINKTELTIPSPLAGEGKGEGCKKASHRNYTSKFKSYSRTLRHNQTEPEKIIWHFIRNNQTGFKFRRQFNIDNRYIVDFVCLDKKLVIEIDGETHVSLDDEKNRTDYIESQGFEILRFCNADIVNNMEGCWEVLINKLNSFTPHPDPLPQGEREKSKVIIIAGPTASGKSTIAKELALKENGVVINCDSMQVYDVLRVITARPSEGDEKEVEHRLYGYLSPEVACNADIWRKDALREIDDVIANGKLPILVGGTGMYIKSLMEGLSPIPTISEDVRAEARSRIAKEGSQSLYNEIAEDDRARLSENDTQRICRAYEVLKATGKSMTEWNSQENVGIRKDLDFDLRIVMPDFEELYKRCDERFSTMIEQGALEEVKQLMEMNLDSTLPAMKAIGVPEIMAHIRGEISLEEAIEKASQQTRNYAKRQRTFFKKI